MFYLKMKKKILNLLGNDHRLSKGETNTHNYRMFLIFKNKTDIYIVLSSYITTVIKQIPN